MPSDKVLHFIAGAVVAIFSCYLFGTMTGFVLAVAIGAGKELHDYIRPESNTADIWNFVATSAGAAIGALLVFILNS